MTKGFLGDAEMPALDPDSLPQSFVHLTKETLLKAVDMVEAAPYRSPYEAMEAILSAQIGMQVIVDDRMPDDKMWVLPHDHFLMGALGHGATLYRQEPTETRWQAVEIVQDGLADWVEYLRAHGHHLPDWEQQQRAEENTRMRGWLFDPSERLNLDVLNPLAVIKGLP